MRVTRLERSSKTGQTCCGECLKVYRQTRPKLTPAEVLAKKCKKFGITPVAFLSMLHFQREQCAVCRGDWDVKGPQIDHCHDTGKVRGVLCRPCNTAIGTLGDTADSVRRAVVYLERR